MRKPIHNPEVTSTMFFGPLQNFSSYFTTLDREKRHTLHVPPPRDIEWPPNHPPTGTATIDFSTNLILDHGSHTCNIDGERRDWNRKSRLFWVLFQAVSQSSPGQSSRLCARYRVYLTFASGRKVHVGATRTCAILVTMHCIFRCFQHGRSLCVFYRQWVL